MPWSWALSALASEEAKQAAGLRFYQPEVTPAHAAACAAPHRGV